MVKYNEQSLDEVFSALGDPTRRAIMAQLSSGDLSVSEIAAPHEMSLPAVSKHLNVLENAGLIRRLKQGRVISCKLTPEPLQNASAWFEDYKAFWEERLNSLSDYLDTLKE
jgi:DNA-binding transcriptional ArsR family regulator